MMKNKGFVLMETIVVIVVISVALLTIFSSYNKILSKVKSENKYDTSEYIYMTKYIKDNLSSLCGTITINDLSSSITNYYSTCTNKNKLDIYGVNKIYVLTNLNTTGTYGYKLDAYMIDYIKKLDVNDEDKVIVIEYKRPTLKTDGTQKKMYYYDSSGTKKEKNLYETYIASLEW